MTKRSCTTSTACSAGRVGSGEDLAVYGRALDVGLVLTATACCCEVLMACCIGACQGPQGGTASSAWTAMCWSPSLRFEVQRMVLLELDGESCPRPRARRRCAWRPVLLGRSETLTGVTREFDAMLYGGERERIEREARRALVADGQRAADWVAPPPSRLRWRPSACNWRQQPCTKRSDARRTSTRAATGWWGDNVAPTGDASALSRPGRARAATPLLMRGRRQGRPSAPASDGRRLRFGRGFPRRKSFLWRHQLRPRVVDAGVRLRLLDGHDDDVLRSWSIGGGGVRPPR